MRRLIIRTLFAAAIAASASQSAGRTVVLRGPPLWVLGDEHRVEAAGLAPNAAYRLSLEQEDEQGGHWCSSAMFRSDHLGRLSTASQPTSGSYSRADTSGLFWSATACPEERKGGQHENARFATFKLARGRRSVATYRATVWLKAPEITEEIVDELHGAKLLRPASQPVASAIVVGGSEGGLNWARRIAALLAHHRIAALALPYFRYRDLPNDLAEIPLERISDASTWLDKRYPGLPIGALGYSRGAELVLLGASIDRRIGRVVCISPASGAMQAFLPPEFPPRSSWTIGGQGVPFLRYSPDAEYRKTGDAVRLRLQSLAATPMIDAAFIPVERITGRVLLISGSEDKVWPASLMAEQVRNRAILKGREDVTHLRFNNAGHMLFGPGWTPTALLARYGGGDAQALADAQRASWDVTLSALRGQQP